MPRKKKVKLEPRVHLFIVIFQNKEQMLIAAESKLEAARLAFQAVQKATGLSSDQIYKVDHVLWCH